MNGQPANVHATAIVVGTRGLLFLGASGSGKSDVAFACLAAAKARGAYAALVADDQVLISGGDRPVAQRPTAIAGLLELRCCAIVELSSVARAPVDLVIHLVDPATAERLPDRPTDACPPILAGIPAIRLSTQMREPLAAIGALHAEFEGELPFL